MNAHADMDALIAFFSARLDDDEAYLNSNRHHLWTDRPLREVAAKRAILRAWPDPFGNWSASEADAAHAMKVRTLRIMVTVWSDHPDYDTDWAPESALRDAQGGAE